MNKCIECGASCKGEFCSAYCEDLWKYGPTSPPGWSILEVPINHLIGEGQSKRKHIGPL